MDVKNALPNPIRNETRYRFVASTLLLALVAVAILTVLALAVGSAQAAGTPSPIPARAPELTAQVTTSTQAQSRLGNRSWA